MYPNSSHTMAGLISHRRKPHLAFAGPLDPLRFGKRHMEQKRCSRLRGNNRGPGCLPSFSSPLRQEPGIQTKGAPPLTEPAKPRLRSNGRLAEGPPASDPTVTRTRRRPAPPKSPPAPQPTTAPGTLRRRPNHRLLRLRRRRSVKNHMSAVNQLLRLIPSRIRRLTAPLVHRILRQTILADHGC
jgi:hypothetical protein